MTRPTESLTPTEDFNGDPLPPPGNVEETLERLSEWLEEHIAGLTEWKEDIDFLLDHRPPGGGL